MRTPTYSGTLSQVKGPHLIVQELGDELVIFDRRTNKAHLLDARAAAVFHTAEDGCSLDDVAGVVGSGTGAQRQAAARLAISELERAGVLVSDIKAVPRRGLLRTLGSLAAFPMVISILAPRAAAASSCGGCPGEYCLDVYTTAVKNSTCNGLGTKEVLSCSEPLATLGAGCKCTANSECCRGTCYSDPDLGGASYCLPLAVPPC